MTGSAVPAWPVVAIEMAADGSVRVDGDVVPMEPGDDPRSAGLAAASATARFLGRAVRVEAVEPDGTVYPLIVATDGSVTEAGPGIPPPQERTSRFGRRKKAPAAESRRAPRGALRIPLPDPPSAPGAVPSSSAFPPPDEATPPPAPAPRSEEHQLTTGVALPLPRTAPNPVESTPDAALPTPDSMASATPVETDEHREAGLSWRPSASAAPSRAAESSGAVRSPGVPEGTEPFAFAPGEVGAMAAPTPTRDQAGMLQLMRRAIDEGDYHRALSIAARLDTLAPQADARARLAAREVHAYVALLTGRPALAVELYTDAVAIARDAHDSLWRTQMLENAHFCWLRVTDPQTAQMSGRLVMDAYAAVGGADMPAFHAARERMRVMTGNSA